MTKGSIAFTVAILGPVLLCMAYGFRVMGYLGVVVGLGVGIAYVLLLLSIFSWIDYPKI